jgi:hypothetical protein
MITYVNNPFDTVIQAVNELYPDTNAEIQFNPNIKFFKIFGFKFGHCGETIFPEDGSSPLINISTNIPFMHMPEILGHELAHVVTGKEHKHDEVWQDAFHKIQEKFTEIVMRNYKVSIDE